MVMYFLKYHNPGPILKRGFGDFSKIFFSQWGKSSNSFLEDLNESPTLEFPLGKKKNPVFKKSAFGRMTRDPEFKKHFHPPKMGGFPPLWNFGDFLLGFPQHFGRVRTC